MRITALCGGVGGAKLALGLDHAASSLNLIVNTGDDFTHYALKICPDLDTVAYTLSGRSNAAQGWGRADESFAVQTELAALSEDIWFQLGDRDIAFHLIRLKALAAGATLTDATALLAGRLGIRSAVLPMTDADAPTLVDTDEGLLAFQDYFVGRRCAPIVRAVRHGGGDVAPSPAALAALRDPALDGIILCPSNPLLSIQPILAVPALRQALADRTVPALAVCPLIGGEAIKGPTAKMMRELGIDASAAGVARLYAGLIDAFVLDEADAHEAEAIRALGMTPLIAPTLMKTLDEKIALARFCLENLRSLR